MKHPNSVRHRAKRRRTVYCNPNAVFDNLYFTRKSQELLGGILSSAGFAAIIFMLVALS